MVWEDPLEGGTASHPSILAWRIPWIEEPGRLQFMGNRYDVLMKQNEELDLFEFLHFCKVKDEASGKLVLAPRCLREYPPVDYRKLPEEAVE